MADQAGASGHAAEGVGTPSPDQPSMSVEQNSPNQDYTCDPDNLTVRYVERMRFLRPLLPRLRRVALSTQVKVFGLPANVHSHFCRLKILGEIPWEAECLLLGRPQHPVGSRWLEGVGLEGVPVYFFLTWHFAFHRCEPNQASPGGKAANLL